MTPLRNGFWDWAATEMGFHFPLETVLRLRRTLEDRERMRLEMLVARRTQLELAATSTLEAGGRLRESLVRGLEAGALPAVEVEFACRRDGACKAEVGRIRHATAALEKQIEHQRAVYLERSVGRKVIEGLRERQLEHYQSAMESRMQAQLEELALLRRARK